MSIASHLLRIKTNINNSLNRLLNKGVTIPEGANSDNLAELINNVPQHSEYPNGREWTECTINGTLSTEVSNSSIKGFVKLNDSVLYAYSARNILKSTDGVNWEVLNHNLGYLDIRTIVYFKGVFVSITKGPSTSLMYSLDMITWISITSVASAAQLKEENGLLILYTYGDNSPIASIRISSDGKIFKSIQLPNLENYYNVLYNRRTFIVKVEDGLKISYDIGQTWVDAVFDGITVDKNIRSIKYTDGIYVAGVEVPTDDSLSGTYYSDDGESWVKCAGMLETEYATSLFYCRNKWFACTANNLYYSTDGETWSTCICNTTLSYVANIMYEKGLYVMSRQASSQGVLYSEDGITWIAANISSGPTRTWLNYYNGVFLVTDRVYFNYSTDGKVWSALLRGCPDITVIFKNNLVGFIISYSWIAIYYSTIWDKKSTILTDISDEILVDSTGNVLTTL